jgi:hypothetical protein
MHNWLLHWRDTVQRLLKSFNESAGIPGLRFIHSRWKVRSAGLGSSHSTVPEMIQGVETMLRFDDAYEAASDAALRFMEEQFGEKMVLTPYLEAITGAKLEPFVAARTYPQL